MSTEGRGQVERDPLVGASPDESVGRLRAVLIDDMSEIRMLLRMALEDVGIDVVGEAADGAAGVEVAGACMPDIVILDVSMPVMDGLTALPWIRDTLPDAKIIMLSAFDRELCEEPALERGADAYVEKGQVDQLIRTVLELGGVRPESRPVDSRDLLLPAPRGDLTSPLHVVPPIEEPSAPAAAPASDDALADELAVARASLDQLAYMVSHDLAEPINLIVGFAQRLERRWVDAESADREFLGYVTAAALRAQAMLDDISAYVKSGIQELPVETVDCQQVVADVRAVLAGRIRETGAVIHSDLLPTEVVVNRFVLTQVLQNLVANAITFTSPGVVPEVELSASCDGRFWSFRVADNGIGIGTADVERVFLPFKRLHADAYQGNGIGLAICRQLVLRHGGQIGVRSSGSDGTVMAFTLPYLEAPS